MSSNNPVKETLEKQFQDLYDKAKQQYPTIDEDILPYTNATASSERLQDYLELTMQTPYGVANNHTVLV
jgi:hypothetical protein